MELAVVVLPDGDNSLAPFFCTLLSSVIDPSKTVVLAPYFSNDPSKEPLFPSGRQHPAGGPYVIHPSAELSGRAPIALMCSRFAEAPSIFSRSATVDICACRGLAGSCGGTQLPLPPMMVPGQRVGRKQMHSQSRKPKRSQ